MKRSFDSNSVVYHWDRQWQDDVGRKQHLKTEPLVTKLLPELQRRGTRDVLDLGCGVGRHSLMFAQAGMHVTAVDLSPNGLDFTKQRSQELGLDIDFHQVAMHNLPLADASIDYCLSWNVIYHGTVDDLIATVREVSRVLRPGGIFQATLLSKRNLNFCLGKEIAPDTWINTMDEEKAHPHCYRNACEVSQLLTDAEMELWSLVDMAHEKPESYHWHLLAEKNK